MSKHFCKCLKASPVQFWSVTGAWFEIRNLSRGRTCRPMVVCRTR